MGYHTDACIKRMQDALVRYQAWVAQWPDYCKKCDGDGFQRWTENQSPIGSGYYWPEPFSEPCACLEQDQCPRCQRAMDIEEDWEWDNEVTCPHCGWRSGDPDMCPEIPEDPCRCEVEDATKMYANTYASLGEGEF